MTTQGVLAGMASDQGVLVIHNKITRIDCSVLFGSHF